MKVSVSNLAWTAENDQAAATELQRFGVEGIDLAPGRYFDRPWEAPVEDWKAIGQHWESRGFELVGMQSLLFGAGTASIFGSADDRAHISLVLRGVAARASSIGITRLVFGSPRNRLVGTFSKDPVSHAADFFFAEGSFFAELGVSLLIEPNSTRYGCDFLNSTKEALAFADIVGSPGIGVNFDFGAEEDSPSFADIEERHELHIGHVHLSNSSLSPLQELPSNFEPYWARLNSHSGNWLAIEQLGDGSKRDLEGLTQSLENAVPALRGIA